MLNDVTPRGLLSLLLIASPAAAVKLWATSYNDHALYTLNLAYEGLTVTSKSLDCGSEPTWITLDKGSRPFNDDATLETLDILPVLKSPGQRRAIWAEQQWLGRRSLRYVDLQLLRRQEHVEPGPVPERDLHHGRPGPVPDRQDVPHLHHTILDPTKKFIVVPDLGADLLRVYALQQGSIEWTEIDPVKAVPGSGPRHGVFATAGPKTFFYILNELSNTISGYRVTYKRGALKMTRLFDFSSHGPGGSVPAGTKAAELKISPDQRFVIASLRGENSLMMPNLDPRNSTAMPSDPLISFRIDRSTGALAHVQTAAAGGRNPRGFNINKAGTLVASALQDDNRVVVYERDVSSGELMGVAGWATVGEGEGNGPNYALFDE
ncbi:Lactonase- 7-bladed beta-propeller-domain-containing protein [Apiospora phragmitis]|uniref:Lactonase- 7-bladed beta-propeller-domain-containing protein n=1 Tax=Apiospora phragmitis TaxID=2905665 RepID=A0ABR1TWA3_9PEZI